MKKGFLNHKTLKNGTQTTLTSNIKINKNAILLSTRSIKTGATINYEGSENKNVLNKSKRIFSKRRSTTIIILWNFHLPQTTLTFERLTENTFEITDYSFTFTTLETTKKNPWELDLHCPYLSWHSGFYTPMRTAH